MYNYYLKKYTDRNQTFYEYFRSLGRKSVVKISDFLIGDIEIHNCIQFVYFHHLFADEVDGLRSILRHLSEKFVFISYSEAINKLKLGQINKPYLCFSSDDGFKNNLRVLEIFKEFNISCCFFVCPGIIENQGMDSEAEISSKVFNFKKSIIEFLNWSDIEKLLKEGHEIGSHSYSHRNLVELRTTEYELEFGESKRILERKVGFIKHFAFPYGRKCDINESIFKAISEFGYESIASAIRGAYFPTHKLSNEELILRDPLIFFEPFWINYYFLKKNQLKWKN